MHANKMLLVSCKKIVRLVLVQQVIVAGCMCIQFLVMKLAIFPRLKSQFILHLGKKS